MRVVAQKSYSVCLEDGRHLPPGGVAKCAASPFNLALVEKGDLYRVEEPVEPQKQPRSPRSAEPTEEVSQEITS
jgi:hypothetical protein